MAEDKISKKILEEAEKERDKILENARKAQEAEIEEAKRRAKELEERATQEAEKLREREREKILGLERIELKKAFLKAKQDLIGEVFEKTIKRIVELPDKEYRAFMKRLFEATVESGDEKVILGTDEKRLNSSFLETLNSEKGWNLKLSDERRPIKGGFILVKDKVEINASLDFLVEMARYELTPLVAEKLMS